jgi:hypothetical protein
MYARGCHPTTQKKGASSRKAVIYHTEVTEVNEHQFKAEAVSLEQYPIPFATSLSSTMKYSLRQARPLILGTSQSICRQQPTCC